MRVHELAKELGLKSQDLIEFIKAKELDVKPSTFAGIDSEMVDRIKQLYLSSPGQTAPAERRRPTQSKAQDTPAPTAVAEAPPAPKPRPEPPQSAAAQPRPEPPRAASPPAFVSPPSAGPSRANEPAPRQNDVAPTPPSRAPEPAERPQAGPLSAYRSGGGRSGPLAGHTPHRGSYGSQRPGNTPASADTNANTGPLRRSDYISPYGTRSTAPPVRPTPAPPRRPADAPAQEPRREGPVAPRPGRPLPPVASLPTVPTQPRRPDAPRAAGPQTPTQRPDKKYTAEQLREMMMRSGGQIGAKGAPGTARPGQPQRGPVPPGPIGVGIGPVGRGPIVDEEEERGKGAHPHGRLGSAADRAGRRAERSKRAIERKTISSPMPVSALIDDDDGQKRSRGLRRSHKGGRGTLIAPRKTEAIIEPPITVRSLSEAIGVKGSDLRRKLLDLGHGLVTINTSLDPDTAVELGLEFGVEVSIHYERTAEDDLLDAFDTESNEEHQVLRPPVVTILGHVDHGKTSLLDRIRRANVVASESGGITQHIGAYQIEHNGQRITFVDTPGHEAFTAMRARGANVTDIVVLVVAADDGIMPQTMEAIAHAKAAEVPVIVALSKIDLPNVQSTANINKIYGELALQGLSPHEWGGETEVVKTSVVTGDGIDDLLLTLEYIAEHKGLKADPSRSAVGTCLEASISEGRGVLATILVQDGTLRVGDVIVCGDGYGRVRALFNDLGQPVTEAGPSTPVEVSGLDSVPTAGEKFAVVEDIGRAREIAETRRARGRGASGADRQELTLENIFSKMSEQKVKSLNLILKADVQGSIEAIAKELEKLKNDEVPIRVLHKAVGGISESDVTLAEASDAIIIGFRVAPEDRAISLADEKKIDVRRYDIIYQVTDEIKKAVEGLLEPDVKEVPLGGALVRQLFKISKVGTVAGCLVSRGTIERGAKARVLRDSIEIYKGAIEVLKRFKDDVKEVREGYECGVKITNFDDIKVGDTIEAYRVEVIKRTL